MKQIKCILYLFVALTFLIHLTAACYAKACPKNYRQAYVGREEYKCVTIPDKSGKCPLGSNSDKVFGCSYDTSKKGKKTFKQEYNTQMFGQRKSSSDKVTAGKGTSVQGASRGGTFFGGGGGRGGGGGGKG